MEWRNLFMAAYLVAPPLLGWIAYESIVANREPPRLTRLVAGNLVVFAFLLSTMILAAEIYLRYFLDESDAFGNIATERLWVQRHVRLNNWGYRDDIDYFDSPKPGTIHRVTFIGDSFTDGGGIRDIRARFPDRIRQMHPDWEVHLLARAGWNTKPELILLDKLDAQYRLDVAVLVYCLNDVSDISPRFHDTIARVGPMIERAGHWLDSYLLNWLFYRWIATHDLDFRDSFRRVIEEGHRGDLWQQKQAQLRLLKAAVEKRGGRLMVVTFPMIEGLDADYPYRSAHDQISQFWASEHVPHLDLLPAFEHYRSSELMVNRFDLHPNERAHQIASVAIDKFLTDAMAVDPHR